MFVRQQIFNYTSRMSLVSASKIVGGLKEYVYRGIQQLPIVIGSTSFLYTVATGSLAHLNIFFGMALLIPLYTLVLNMIITFIMDRFAPRSIFWKRSGGDTCKIIPPHTNNLTFDLFKKDAVDGGAIPSYWLMELSFFIGYCISNAVDSLQTPAAPGSSDINHERRNTQAIYIIAATSIFAILVLGMRLIYMQGCEGASYEGFPITFLAAAGAGGIGYGVYLFSRKCGARSSDLFGVLSQILPPSSTTPTPVVCTSNDS